MKRFFAIFKFLFVIILGFILGDIICSKIKNSIIIREVQKANKFKNYYNLLNKWLINKNQQKKLEYFFYKNNYTTIAIYGMGELGKNLFYELKDSKIKIKYVIDKNKSTIISDLHVIDIEDKYEKVDVIVVTAISEFDKIKEELNRKVMYPIISLEEVVFNI